MNETGERFVKADMIYVMPDCEGCHARLDRASDVVIPSVAKNLQLLLAFPEKSCIFAVDSSWGIRVEGMTTLSSHLMRAPKSRCLGGFYFFAEMQY